MMSGLPQPQRKTLLRFRTHVILSLYLYIKSLLFSYHHGTIYFFFRKNVLYWAKSLSSTPQSQHQKSEQLLNADTRNQKHSFRSGMRSLSTTSFSFLPLSENFTICKEVMEGMGIVDSVVLWLAANLSPRPFPERGPCTPSL